MKFNRCFGCMEEIPGYPCPNCNFDPAQAAAPNYVLPCGTILNGRYLVGKMLGRGGFGITYIGFDLMLERKVAIKEYYPSGQVSRITTISTELQWMDSEQPDQLRENGIRSCLREARKMAKIEDIPEVVRVLDCFPENDTAYIVMEYVDGKTLMSVLREQGPMTWDQAKEIFLPAISAMEEVHQAGTVHRDISPDNLMMTKKGVRILDLGAAKDLGINNGTSSALVVKGGFSPLEQYAHQGGSGPWTDVYAMAATIYHCLTGVIPPSALDRSQEDTMDWALLKANGVPNHVITALQNAMKITARERTQSMAELLSQCQSNSAGRSKPNPVPEPDTNKKQPPVTEAPVHIIKKRIGSVFNQFRKDGNSKAIGFAITFCAVVAVLIIFFMKGNARKGTPQLNAYEPTAHIVNTESAIEHTDSDDANSNQMEPARSTVSEETEINTSVVNVNDVLSFGHYEQDGIRSNGSEMIEWLVLDVQENKALLLSLYALDSLPYNNVYGNTTWEQCSLRNWLNGTFLETAFTAEEKTSILMTEVDNSRLQNNDEWPVKGSNNTEDLIFLLSYADTDRYFANAEARICTPTDYAVSMGADVRTLDDGITSAGWWWLRSPGEDSKQASFVNFDGTRYTNVVGNGYLSVRPALWIDLENYVPANEAADPQITEKRPIAADGGEKQSAIIDPNCEHIFEVLNGKDGIETKCRFCGISMEALNDAGIVLEEKDCECEYEPIIQTNGTPAYECKKCHKIQAMSIAPLTSLKKIADTNANGKDNDVKLGDFYEKGEKLTDMIRFWVSNKSGYENSESIDLYLANSYSNILGHVFAGDDCDPNANMTLRFYGDGVLLDEIQNITIDVDYPVEVEVTDVEVLRIECITNVSDFGYCFIQASAWY